MIILLVFFIFGEIAQRVHGKSPSKILSGEDAERGEFPWQVSLRKYDKHICGGTIISNRHILTAAHCIKNIIEPPYSEMTVVTGSNSLLPGTGAKAYRVQNVTIHPNYVLQTRTQAGRHDIAVITVKKEIEQNDLQKSISLPSKNTPHNVHATVTGFGRTSAHSQSSNILQKADITLLSSGDCFANGVRVVATQICGYTGTTIGTCYGDSGGPLVYDNTVVGVVSTSGPCSESYPGVYTRVFSHLDFIKSAMNNI